MSEKKLWEEFKSNYDMKYIFKNILFLGILWIIINYILPSSVQDYSRMNLFLELFFIGIIYFALYVGFNFKDFKFFVLEFKRLKEKKW
jgi:hypothetical protein